MMGIPTDVSKSTTRIGRIARFRQRVHARSSLPPKIPLRQYIPSSLLRAWPLSRPSLLRTRFRRHNAVRAIVSDEQTVVFSHVLGIANPVIKMRGHASVAFFLYFRGSVLD